MNFFKGNKKELPLEKCTNWSHLSATVIELLG